MENKEWTFDRPADLSPGPWLDEPDKVQWTDPATGLPCLAVRGPSNAWCGYVGVSKGHPYFEKDYEACDVEVHGGLTFADKCSGNEHGICHVVEEGDDDNVWWLGFDCAHSGDLCPYLWRRDGAKFYPGRRPPSFGLADNDYETYKTLDYVKGQVTRLAKQLHAMTDN